MKVLAIQSNITTMSELTGTWLNKNLCVYYEGCFEDFFEDIVQSNYHCNQTRQMKYANGKAGYALEISINSNQKSDRFKFVDFKLLWKMCS